MASIIQIIGQLRFQLEQLSARNAHHEFEHFCRHLARARICSNILPATGPVSAGGDQGRDFETFRTYLKERLAGSSGFVGLVSNNPIVFACSITKPKFIDTKIKSDIESIATAGTKVSDIHFFCTADVPVSNRHAIQKWAKDQHEIYLEIHDGQSIAELLSERDVFWIAAEFLNIPAEIYPPAPEGRGSKWYDDLLEMWKSNNQSPQNYADFIELKSAIRHATFTDSVKQDIPFWIGLLNKLRDFSRLNELKRRCTYEIAVARLRGQGSLHDFEDDLRQYFSDIANISDITELENITVLLSFCVAANKIGEVSLKHEEVSNWISLVTSKVDDELKEVLSPGRKCLLLKIRGFIYLSLRMIDTGKPELNKAIECWRKVLELIDQAPLFPLERLADFFTLLIELGFNNSKIEDLIQKTDEALQARHGGFAAADKSRDRAIAFHRRGEIIEAINQLHNAKIKWFAEETLRGSLLTTLLLSQLYLELNLVFASKHYSLITAYIALNCQDENLRDFVPSGLKSAAAADYKFGSFCGFLNLADIMLLTYSVFSKEYDPSEFNEINWSLFHTTTLRSISSILIPEILPWIDSKKDAWGLNDYFVDLIPLADKNWLGRSNDEIKRGFNAQGLGVPWNDLGRSRAVNFSALGISWIFRWRNDYSTNAEAEGFLAAFQILLASLSGIDLCLIKTQVDVTLNFVDSWNFHFYPEPSNDRVIWKVDIPNSKADPPKEGKLRSINEIIIATASAILVQLSVYKKDDFMKAIECIFAKGVFEKIFFGAPYITAYRAFIDMDQFGSCPRKEDPPFPLNFVDNTEHPLLSWIDTPGPFYSKEKSMKGIKNRYENALLPVRITLNALSKDSSFFHVATKLKNEGWKDWHLLLAICNVVTNHRVNEIIKLLPKRPLLNEQNDLMKQQLSQAENEFSIPIPLNEFSEEKLRNALRLSMIATLKQWGHENHIQTPNFSSINLFLSKRYFYWTDDIEHADFGFGSLK